MPPMPSVAGVCRVEIRINDDASIDAGSRFFVQYSGAPPSGAQQVASAAGVAAAWGANLAPVTSNKEHLDQVTVTDLSSATGSVGQWSGSTAGTLGVGDQLPAGVCAVVNHQISRRYRGGKPRIYLRCGDTSYLGAMNQFTAGAQGNILAGWEAFIAGVKAISGANFTNIVNISYWGPPWTYPLNPSGRPIAKGTLKIPPVVDQVTSSSVAVKLGSQRRRLAL